MASIFLGTCSWTDKPLIDSRSFYPPQARSPESRLRFYASIFPTVEVDSTYYAIPSPERTSNWVDRTPSNFVFHAKAFRLLTKHWASPEVLAPEMRRAVLRTVGGKRRFYDKDLPSEVLEGIWDCFVVALSPLRAAGKLGRILFQFAPWVFPSTEMFEYIEFCRTRLIDFKLAVEFRNASWLNEQWLEQTLGFLREHDISYVCVDEPQGYPTSMPPLADATSNVGYLRFHGRNEQTWHAQTKTSGERFDHWYRDEELEGWVSRIKTLQRDTDEIHILFNTNNEDQGPQNASRLARVLQGNGLGINVANIEPILAIGANQLL